MSADNGVYILETPTADGGSEWRVAHLQAIENLEMNRCSKHGSDPKVQIQNAREMFSRSGVHTSQSSALAKAAEIYESLDICEYGICLLYIPEQF